MYQTFRTGPCTCTLSGLTANARYTLRLHFADPTSTAAGQRKFNVVASGTSALSACDVFADAGGPNRTVVKPLNVRANAAGQISVALTNVAGSALISALDVLPGSSYWITTGAAVAMVGAYQAEQFASGGSLFSTTHAISTAL